MRTKVKPKNQTNNIKHFRQDVATHYRQYGCPKSKHYYLDQIFMQKLFISLGDVKQFDILVHRYSQCVILYLIKAVYVCQTDKIHRYQDFCQYQFHSSIIIMQIDSIPIQTTPKKRYCCGAAKRLKQKCLRFHNQNEEKCMQFIRGHQQCVAVKKQYESKFLQPIQGVQLKVLQ